MVYAKPFVKWAGGKASVVEQLNRLLPPGFDEWEDVTYIEPFVGGGALLFYMLRFHNNIRRVVINDINKDLIWAYHLVKDDPHSLIYLTNKLKTEYLLRDDKGKESFYYANRNRYNNDSIDANERAALFLFLNHTCFNGLFRVNLNGHFNVPFGRYSSPAIFDSGNILEANRIMNAVDFSIIDPGDYKITAKHVSKKGVNFFYIDPPYRPLSMTSYYKGYSNDPFGDQQQIELRHFCDSISRKGHFFMLSNSDSKNNDGTSFFDDLYHGYHLCRIEVPRHINADGQGRSRINEVLIRNY